MIPHLIFRCVPEHTTDVVERWWHTACELHPTWGQITYRDPLPPANWPLTAPHWHRCTSGAQFAGLIRLEALVHHGGIYLDSDVELYRPLDNLTDARAFAAWEDRGTIPDAVIGAEPGHPAIRHALNLAIERLDEGAWSSGPGATTQAFRAATGILVLPPATFYPYHYTQPERAGEPHELDPWCYGAHRWAGSWLPRSRAGKVNR
jgi:hypothetical protein